MLTSYFSLRRGSPTPWRFADPYFHAAPGQSLTQQNLYFGIRAPEISRRHPLDRCI
jgi:hypothetical protein